MSQDWRMGTNAEDFLRGNQKRLALDERRPVIRKASDLVGPGIDAAAVSITDYNDVLATFNGYYSSVPGALYAPNTADSFIGFVIMDDTLGGVQTFTSLVSGNEYRRTFLRNPSDEDSLSFGLWHTDETVPATVYSASSINSRIITELDSGEGVQCEMPEMAFIGDPDTYARSVRVLSILRPGVYSGYFWWRTTENITVDTLQIEFPNGDDQTYDVLYLIDGGHGVQVPLHFYTSVETGFIRVTATQSAADNQHAEFMRLHLTRLGDAP